MVGESKGAVVGEGPSPVAVPVSGAGGDATVHAAVKETTKPTMMIFVWCLPRMMPASDLGHILHDRCFALTNTHAEGRETVE